MRVITLTPRLFQEHCRQLQEQARAFDPDLILTVARGGDFLGQHMFTGVHHVSVRCQRPSTASKGRWLKTISRQLPLWVRNLMRCAEARVLASRRPNVAPVTFDSDVQAAICRAGRVLVVDDAIDSGSTMSAVITALNAIPGNRRTAVAVITVTQKNPSIQAQYALYRSETLVRFPWSDDFTANDNKKL